MRAVSGAALAVGRFVYRFIFGDDWTVAVVMLVALAATGVLQAGHIAAWWLVPPLAIIMTGVSLLRARRNARPALPKSAAASADQARSYTTGGEPEGQLPQRDHV